VVEFRRTDAGLSLAAGNCQRRSQHMAVRRDGRGRYPHLDHHGLRTRRCSAQWRSRRGQGSGRTARRAADGLVACAAQTGAADVCLLPLGVAGSIAAAGIGDPRLAGLGVGLVNGALDDLSAVCEYERCPGPGRRLRLSGLGGGVLFGGADAGHDRGHEPEQPATPPCAGTAGPGRYVRAGEAQLHLHKQRRVEDLGPLDVGSESR
jgi:hypothetical protein